MKSLIISFLLFISINLYSQDIIIYNGILGKLSIETFEFYPDSTFKWTNEYDLMWSDYGKYKIEGNQLILDFYIWITYPKTMSLIDSISCVPKKFRTKIFEIENNRIYPLNKRGRRITRRKETFYKRKWAWLLGNKKKYKIISYKKSLRNK